MKKFNVMPGGEIHFPSFSWKVVIIPAVLLLLVVLACGSYFTVSAGSVAG
mgnify:FL=1